MKGKMKMDELLTNVDTNTEVDTGFDDYEEDATLETEEVAEETEEEVQEAPEVEIPYTFLGKEGKMPLTKAQEVLQKGMNYDHVKAENARIKAELDALRQSSTEQTKSQQIAALIAEGYPEDHAKEFIAAKLAKAEAENILKSQQAEKNQEEARKSLLDAFIAEYPEVEPKDWSEAMREAYANGKNIAEIYRKEENARLKAELNALKTNTQNKQKSIGSIDTQQKQPKGDAFLEGLFGDWKDE